MKALFPKEIIENSVEVHRSAHRKVGSYVYSAILIAVILCLASLPIISIPIYKTSRGMLKPKTERVIIRSVHSGNVQFVTIRDNKQVQKGDTLLILGTELTEKKLANFQKMIEESKIFIKDCEYLINTPKPRFHKIISEQYQKEFLAHNQKMQELQTRFDKAKRNQKRSKQLFAKKVIARVEYENAVFEYKIASSTLQQGRSQQKNNWQTAVTGYKNTLSELHNNIADLQQHQKSLVITAPINGVLKNVTGLQPNSRVLAGNTIAEISPDTEMIAECYFSPSDIGLIQQNSAVNFQIDAFHYNQWGLATGYVSDISKDIDMQNNQPVFKVRCILDQKYLELQNGFRGTLTKGMTFNARFVIAERSLFDLLYDKADDWLNPSSSIIANN